MPGTRQPAGARRARGAPALGSPPPQLRERCGSGGEGLAPGARLRPTPPHPGGSRAPGPPPVNPSAAVRWSPALGPSLQLPGPSGSESCLRQIAFLIVLLRSWRCIAPSRAMVPQQISKTELSGAQRSVDLASSRGGWGQVHRSTMNQIQGKKKPTVSSAVCTRLRLMDRSDFQVPGCILIVFGKMKPSLTSKCLAFLLADMAELRSELL
eukprot:XP_017456957.1 PREDICTED: uncharacterized protein LOC108348879 isoform X1 [Rattus norvegicus]